MQFKTRGILYYYYITALFIVCKFLQNAKVQYIQQANSELRQKEMELQGCSACAQLQQRNAELVEKCNEISYLELQEERMLVKFT